MRKIDIKSGNVENYIITSNTQSNLKETAQNENGITLVALVITIIVMLILVGVTISVALKGDLFNIAKKSSVETRGAIVEEKVAEWKANKKIDGYLEENSNTQSLEELLNDLETQQLITNEERKEIEQNMKVKIGDKEILFYELPDGYTRCEYLESTGTQYINTEYIPNSHTKTEIQYLDTSDLNTKHHSFLFGSGKRGSEKDTYLNTFRFMTFFLYDKCYRFDYSDSIYKVDTSIANPDNLKHIVVVDNNTCYLDGNKISQATKNNLTSDLKLYLFTTNTEGTASDNSFAGRIYYCKIWDGGNLVRDYIPVIDENSVACLYDKVEEKIYYNQGEGEFNVGCKN